VSDQELESILAETQTSSEPEVPAQVSDVAYGEGAPVEAEHAPQESPAPSQVEAQQPDEEPEGEKTKDLEIDFVPSDADLRFESRKFAFQALLEKASAVLPTRDVMAVLKNFYVQVDANGLKVISTDLELSVVADSEVVTVQRPGAAVFPGRRVMELVREAADADIVVDVKDGVASIRVDKTDWELQLMDGSEYPPLPELDEIEFTTVERAKFIQAINSVRYAAATESTRPSLQLIDISEGRIRASDGVRFQQTMLMKEAKVDGVTKQVPAIPDIQIPINAVEDLLKLLRMNELEFLDVGESENHLVFRIGSDTFIANKMTALFPPVDEQILKPALANDEKLSCDREDLMSAIKRVRVTADEETSAIVFSLDEDKMTVQSKDKFGNMANETLDVYWKHGPRQLAFNHQHVLMMLEMADVKSCEFFLGADTKTRKSPLLLKDEPNLSFGVLNQIRYEFLS
jgi:DNA polymerase-3 subunit beta